MKKLFACSFLAGLSILLLTACHAEHNAADDRSLLWQISGKGLAKPSFLFGTMHIICKQDYLWTEAMKKALNASEKVCFEMDMDDPEMFQQAALGMEDTSSKALKDYFTVAQYEQLKQFMQDSLGVDISQMPDMKPMMLEMMLTAKMVPCAIPESYEGNIMTIASGEKKEIVGLETLEEQMNLLNNVPDDSAAQSLLSLADSFSKSKAQYTQMVASYKNQDLPQLYAQVKKSKDEGLDMDAFLDERNKKWIPKIEEKAQKNAVFFAVGAAHLYGPGGLINLLRKAGYTVVPIK